MLTPLGWEQWSKLCQYVVDFTVKLRNSQVQGNPKPFVSNDSRTWCPRAAGDPMTSPAVRDGRAAEVAGET